MLMERIGSLVSTPKIRYIIALSKFCKSGVKSVSFRRVQSSKQETASMGVIDIAANLTDEMYQGVYNDKGYHPPDLDQVLQRAKDAGVEKIIITGGNLEMSRQALQLADSDACLFSTVGVHPTRCNEFLQNPVEHLASLMEVAKEGMQKQKVVAIGECGLDYDRLNFCVKEIQQQYFANQFLLADETKLPMFLHMRAACDDFINILHKNIMKFHGGIVHSFTGTLEDMQKLLKFDNLFIGINGCSLKTEENLNVVSQIPLELLMVETDCPYCEIRSSHAGRQYIHSDNIVKSIDKKKHNGVDAIKGRNEPCNVRHVLDVLSAIRNEDRATLESQIHENTMRLFKGLCGQLCNVASRPLLRQKLNAEESLRSKRFTRSVNNSKDACSVARSNDNMNSRRNALLGLSVATLTIISQRENNASSSELTEMEALKGKDYGKPKMSYKDFTMTDSGLQYKDLESGSGKEVKDGDQILIDWDGYTIGYYGRPFEARNKAKGGAFVGDEKDFLKLMVGDHSVIPGFEEALIGMKSGGVRRIVVPVNIGYPNNSYRNIGPKPSTFSGQRALSFVLENQGMIDKTLLFDIEIMKIY